MDEAAKRFSGFYIEVTHAALNPGACLVSFYVQPREPHKRGIDKPPRVARAVIVEVRLGTPPEVIRYTETQQPVPGLRRIDYEKRALSLVISGLCDADPSSRPPASAPPAKLAEPSTHGRSKLRRRDKKKWKTAELRGAVHHPRDDKLHRR